VIIFDRLPRGTCRYRIGCRYELGWHTSELTPEEGRIGLALALAAFLLFATGGTAVAGKLRGSRKDDEDQDADRRHRGSRHDLRGSGL
jgi:hypothetical protein